MYHARLALPLLLTSTFALADTDVYLTNNGPEPVQIEVRHDGPLQEGSQWTQHRQELGPWERAMVLSFNRYEGVKAGQIDRFETRVTAADGSRYSLSQEMVGTWWNTTLRHGGATDETRSGWLSDRTIHRLPGARELAFAARFTGRYDDLDYQITAPQSAPTPSPDEGRLSVATYNIWALPVIAKSIGERLTLLPSHLKGYDALLLQEVFDGRRDTFLQALAKEYPYQTKVLDKPGINIHDGGVVIVSRYPIVREAQFVYPDCTGTDCFADKGVVYAEVIKGGKAWHLFATHTAAFDTDAARATRQTQFRQIRDFAARLAIPKGDTVLYGGDFNVNKRKFPDDYAGMLAGLNAHEPGYAGWDATFDPRVNAYSGGLLSGGANVEYLDYVMVSQDHAPASANRNTVFIPRTSAAGIWPESNLSDHFPIHAEVSR
ncbi:sphingomyelin phosphodiesterase [Aeromonas diversa]|uniref:sphingomyelin phosphodiesterase n=1 Tax=Aeromonas diversa TaxID=502790 RepID=UPI003462557A